MSKLLAALEDAKSVGIAGHIRPDGDCIGSCMGLYLYLKKNYPTLCTDVYLEELKEGFTLIEGLEDIQTICPQDKVYDLFITLDVSAADRIGVAKSLFQAAKTTMCIDHHISNEGFGDINIIFPDISSTCEVLFWQLEEEKIDIEIAVPIYTGIVHDTGVFQYSSTTSKTMEAAGKLMDKGIPFSDIIDQSFYTKSYAQNQILGRCLMESLLVLDGRCIVGIVRRKDMDFYGLKPKDLDGIVNQLRVTRGVEVAIFLYETGSQEYKVSLRSNERVDVNEIACYFGGGGHVRAAGCTMQGSFHDVVNNLTRQIEMQMIAGNQA